MTNADLARFYNKELLSLAAEADFARRLENPDMTAHAVSPICGSVMDVDIKMSGGKVTDFGFEIEACALTKTVVVIMAKAIAGKTRDQIAAAGQEMEKMLSDGNVFPSGDWAALKILAPVKDYPARHDSLLLPFEAVEKAFRSAILKA